MKSDKSTNSRILYALSDRPTMVRHFPLLNRYLGEFLTNNGVKTKGVTSLRSVSLFMHVMCHLRISLC